MGVENAPKPVKVILWGLGGAVLGLGACGIAADRKEPIDKIISRRSFFVKLGLFGLGGAAAGIYRGLQEPEQNITKNE